MSELTPIFGVRDMSEAIDFYERLGFEVVAYDETYVFVLWQGHEMLHLRAGNTGDRSGAWAYWHVDDADVARERLHGLSEGIGEIA